jgi:hypothetical protein
VPPLSVFCRNLVRDYAATNRLNFAIKRDLRRAALFLWMMPLPATRSSMLIASPTAVAATVASPARIATSAFLTYVRAAVRYGRFRSRRRSETRMRFSADLLFAKVPHLVCITESARGTPKSGPLAVTVRWYQTGRFPTSAGRLSGVAP